jgi:HPt (histidine-containing phosphotransfer) domain-containing protein
MSTYAADFPTLDAERVEMLRELCTDAGPEMLHEMLGSWETEAKRYLTTARSALAAADAVLLKTTAHSLKGSCANMGIVRLAELSRLLEGQSVAPVEAAALLSEMDAELALAHDKLSGLTAA